MPLKNSKIDALSQNNRLVDLPEHVMPWDLLAKDSSMQNCCSSALIGLTKFVKERMIYEVVESKDQAKVALMKHCGLEKAVAAVSTNLCFGCWAYDGPTS